MSSRLPVVIRPMARSHLGAVLAVVDADRLLGQPSCSVRQLLGAAGLRDAVAGAAAGSLRPPGEAWTPQTVVAIGDRVLGAVCFAHREDVGVIRWLHAHERPGVVGRLLDHAIGRLARCESLQVFGADGIGPATAGLADARATTQEALAVRGFVARPAGRYLHHAMASAPLAAPEGPDLGVTRIDAAVYGNQHRLTVTGPRGDRLAEVTVSVLAPGHGMLHWIEVHPGHRGRGLGGRLLRVCLGRLHDLGVRHVIGHLDDHNLTADDGNGRIGAHIICSRAGFTTGAQLSTYYRSA